MFITVKGLKMKIVEAITDTNIGGAGVLLLTRLMTDREMCDKTVVLIPEGSMLKGRFERYGIAFLEVDGCRDRSFEYSVVLKFICILKRLSPDIVNCHGCLSCRVAALICGIPVRIYTRHCVFPVSKWQKNIISRFFIGRAQVLLSNGIIAVAESAKDNLCAMGVPSKRITVIINGVKGLSRFSDIEREKIKSDLGLPLEARIVGIFARLEVYKGHMDLINAAEILLSKSKSYYFLAVGGGSLEGELKEECRRRGLDGHIIFTGFAEDVTPFFNITDVNVNCSSGTETSSLALSEGMSLGIPAVASDFGGNCYMVENGINGYIYPTKDHVALADSIYRITNDDVLYGKLSNGAYGRFKRELNAENMTEATYDMYRKLYRVKCRARTDI